MRDLASLLQRGSGRDLVPKTGVVGTIPNATLSPPELLCIKMGSSEPF